MEITMSESDIQVGDRFHVQVEDEPMDMNIGDQTVLDQGIWQIEVPRGQKAIVRYEVSNN
jgi:hypothetical protein